MYRSVQLMAALGVALSGALIGNMRAAGCRSRPPHVPGTGCTQHEFVSDLSRRMADHRQHLAPVAEIFFYSYPRPERLFALRAHPSGVALRAINLAEDGQVVELALLSVGGSN